MNADPQLLRAVCSKISTLEPKVVEGFLARLEDDYFQEFNADTIAGHIEALASLSGETPVSVLLDREKNGLIRCTIAAFDHPFEFSSITGLMAATGFNIESSDAYTLRPERTSE